VHLVLFQHLDIVPKHDLGPVDQGARVAAAGEYYDDGVEASKQAHQHGAGACAILNARRMNDDRQQISLRADCNMPLAALDLFAGIVTARLPIPVVLADCKSMMATVGDA
jgi:hypothetical protein